MVVQGVCVAGAVILSTQGGSSQRVDICVPVGADYARGTRRGRRLGAHRTLLTLTDDKCHHEFSRSFRRLLARSGVMFLSWTQFFSEMKFQQF